MSLKRLSLLAAALAVLGLGQAARAADVTGMYLSVTGGWTTTGDVDLTDLEGEDSGNLPDQTLELDDGYAAIVAFGFDFGAVRAEAEASYRENDVDSLQIGGFNAPNSSADFEAFSVMVNGIADLPLGDVVSLYAGVGAGIAALDIETRTPAQDTEIAVGALAYQLMAGVSVKLSDHLSLNAGYRLWSTFDVEFDDHDHDDDDNDFNEEDLEGEIDMPIFHSVEIGLRYTF